MRISRECRKFTLVMASSSLLFSGSGCDNKSPAPAEAVKAPSSPPEKPKAPLIKKAELADWCPEHGVPESICTRCNPELIDGFKKKGDWCKEHGMPESQCIACHPELKAKFEKMAPKQP